MKISSRGLEDDCHYAVVNRRVEIHPSHDRWMMGDRFGRLDKIDEKNQRVRVQMDVSGKALWFKPEDVMPYF